LRAPRRRDRARARARPSEAPEIPGLSLFGRACGESRTLPLIPLPSPASPRNQPILPLQSPIRRIGWTRYDVSDRNDSSGGAAGCWVEPVNIMGIGFKSGTLFGAPRRETKTFIIRERARLFASRQASEANPRLSRRPPAKIKPETRPTLRR